MQSSPLDFLLDNQNPVIDPSKICYVAKDYETDNIYLKYKGACLWNEHGCQYWQMLTVYDGDWWRYVVGYLGATLNLIFAIAIYYNKELQVHPYKLYMWISLFEAFTSLIYVNSFIMCEAKMPEIFAWTVFYTNDIYEIYHCLWILRFGSVFL